MTSAQIIDLIQLHAESNDADIMSKIITDLLLLTSTRRIKMEQLYNRYKGEVPILERVFDDPLKINSKIPNDFRGVIIDNNVGYFTGHPITYMYETRDDTDIPQNVSDTLESFKIRNNIEDLDSTTARFAAICGYGARLMYIDKKGKERAMNIKPWESVFIFDTTLEELQYAFCFYTMIEDVLGVSREVIKLEWYDNTNVTFYKSYTDVGKFILDDDIPTTEANPRPHMFDVVPLVKFQNNDTEQGDFEKVEELIDAYDRNLSDEQNETEEFRLAYLAYYGAEPTPEDMKKFRQTGALCFPEGTDAKYLTKDLSGVVAFITHHEQVLNANIYKFAKTVDMSDEKFSGSGQSGESRKWKLLAPENNTITKERKFIRGLRYMFQILETAWTKKGVAFDNELMGFQFTRNLPIEMSSEADTTVKLKGLIPERMRLSLLSFVDDPDAALEEMQEDEKANTANLWNSPNIDSSKNPDASPFTEKPKSGKAGDDAQVSE
jgi:SPP1 family phage portal protein